MSDDQYRSVADHNLMEYPCGLKAGDKLELLRRIEVQDHDGNAILSKRPFKFPRIDAPLVNLNGTGLILEWVVTVDSPPRIRVLGHA